MSASGAWVQVPGAGFETGEQDYVQKIEMVAGRNIAPGLFTSSGPVAGYQRGSNNE